MEKTMEEKLPYNYYIDNEKFLESLIDHKKNVEHAKLNNLPKPKIPNYIGECFIKIATNLAKRPNFYLYCVDDKTEALTKRGWLKYNEITTNDIILSLDPKDLNLKWSKVSDLYINESYSGKCYNIEGKINALVTPGHKWLTKRGLVPVENLRVKEHILINGNAIQNENKNYNDNFVRLVGWFATEGSKSIYNRKKDNEISLYLKFIQSIKSKHCESIIEMMNSFPETDYKISEYEGILNVSINGQLRENIKTVIDFETGNKVITYDFINKLTTEQLLILKQTLMDGDGSGGNVFAQKCKENFDRFLYISTLLGDRVSYKKISNNSNFGKNSDINNYIWTATVQKNKNKYCVVEKLKISCERKLGYRKVKTNPLYDYSGIVWCPSTEFGTFMARRNGKIYITGNSYKDEMIADAIENLCTYLDNFDPELSSKNPFGYFTKISWYAFVRRLAKEKKQQYIKYKATETFGTYNDEELLELEDGSIAQIQIYDNLYEFIEKYEDSLREKKELTSKKKGIENFLLDDSEELI